MLYISFFLNIYFFAFIYIIYSSVLYIFFPPFVYTFLLYSISIHVFVLYNILQSLQQVALPVYFILYCFIYYKTKIGFLEIFLPVLRTNIILSYVAAETCGTMRIILLNFMDLLTLGFLQILRFGIAWRCSSETGSELKDLERFCAEQFPRDAAVFASKNNRFPGVRWSRIIWRGGCTNREFSTSFPGKSVEFFSFFPCPFLSQTPRIVALFAGLPGFLRIFLLHFFRCSYLRMFPKTDECFLLLICKVRRRTIEKNYLYLFFLYYSVFRFIGFNQMLIINQFS